MEEKGKSFILSLPFLFCLVLPELECQQTVFAAVKTVMAIVLGAGKPTAGTGGDC